MATQVVASLLALEAFDDESDIKLYINSPGESQSCAIVDRSWEQGEATVSPLLLAYTQAAVRIL